MDEAAEAYEAKAREYLTARERSNIGSKEVADWSKTLGENATVVDLACGGGYPITSALNDSGLRIWAVDSSPSLVEVFQSRFPEIPVQCKRVQDFDFFDRKFDAAIAIGLVFLLSEEDQVTLISRVSKVLNPGGRFLFSAPNKVAIWDDVCTGSLSRSLGKFKYEEILTTAGFRVRAAFTDTGNNNYFNAVLAQA